MKKRMWMAAAAMFGLSACLDNLGPRAMDSLEFYLQIVAYSVPQNIADPGFLDANLSYFDHYPLAEFHGKVVGLQKDVGIAIMPSDSAAFKVSLTRPPVPRFVIPSQ